MIDIRVQEEDFNLQEEYDRLRHGSGYGAVVTFTGLVRDFDSGGEEGSVSALKLQHYPGMTERLLKEIGEEAGRRWQLGGIVIVHRVGTLLPGDQIVLVAVSGAHREAAFDAASFLMDYLKTRATFWKQTTVNGESRWLEMKDSDRAAARRWRSGGSAAGD